MVINDNNAILCYLLNEKYETCNSKITNEGANDA